MRRLHIGLVLLTVVLAACATRSDRETPLLAIPTGPVAADENVGTGVCLLTTGAGLGVGVEAVDPEGPSNGVLRVGDVIVALGGVATHLTNDLVAAVRSHEIGEIVTVDVSRGSASLTLEVTLAENPDLPGTPRIGIVGVTVNEQVALDTVPAIDDGFIGNLTRVIDIGDRYLAFDPIDMRWAHLRGEVAADTPFLVVGREIYAFDSDPTTGVVTVTAVSSGSSVRLSIGDWEPISLLGSLDGVALLGVQRADSTRESGIETAIFGVDPDSGTTNWSLVVTDQSSGSFYPRSGYLDPFSDRVAVELTPADAPLPAAHFVIAPRAPDGIAATPISMVPTSGQVRGWAGRDRLLWSASGLDEFSATDVRSGFTDALAMSLGDLGALEVWPVGDGEHVLVHEGSRLLLVKMDGTGTRVLTEGCPAPALADPGWGVNR